jgi:serine/threonine protein kinase/tetratricopeptide (TPR) repeat protein
MTDAFDRLKVALADRYAIERELGSGGMATVYLAHDFKHDRKVAVKVFRPELAAALGTERFFREIKITANLNHPHILPLLDSGKTVRRSGGQADSIQGEFLYYVTPYVEGESLRDRLNREKQLSVDEALKITSQVASALSYAHSRDVVHRDIKPENILFQAGEVVVADFGIALAVDSGGRTRLTETGFSLGTPAYMSPEQVSGEQDIDGRSDIYSLACVLYEMLAGDPPFVASSPRAVLAKHMTDPAPPLSTVRSSVPPPVVAAITKALGKAPVDRFDSAKAFTEALSTENAKSDPEVKSIVVLPFDNMSPDPDQEYFSDGLTEEVISDLSKVRALDVISRSSAMTFKGSNKKIPEIATELNVRYVLEGSVRRAGNNLRITAQLIDAERDVHLWADKYTGTLEDVFDVQEKVSRSIVQALTVELSPAEEESISRRPIDNVAAYECHLKARSEVFKFTREATLQALRLLQRGLDIIGDNALLYSDMGYAYWQLVNLGAEQEEYLEKAHTCVERALTLAPELPDAYTVLGWIGHLEGDFQQAARHLKKALELEPDDSFAIGGLAVVYMLVGKITDAQVLSEKWMRLDPLDSTANLLHSYIALYAGKLDRALTLSHSLFEMYPDMPYCGLIYAVALISSDHTEAAITVVDQTAAVDPDNAVTKVALVLKGAVQQDRAATSALMTPDFIKTCQRDCTFALHLAGAFALLGDTDEALHWLDTAVKAGFINYPVIAEHDPLLANLRGEERFKQLMVSVKKKWEEFET